MKKRMLILLGVAVLAFSACDQLEDVSTIDIDTKMDVEVPISSTSQVSDNTKLKSVNEDYDFSGSSDFSLQDNPDLNDYLSNIKGVVIENGSLEIAPLDGENKISSMTISVKKGETLVSSRTFTDMDSKTYNFTNEDVSAFTSMENELGENSSATFTFEVTGTANFEVSTKVKIVFDSTVKASLL